MADVSVSDISLPPAAATSPASCGSNSKSPPPHCAICLGSCKDRSFSDSCMHQFCYVCLSEWAKIKAECPLCKQPFTSIIHNIRSNNEYDEEVIEPNTQNQEQQNQNEFLYLPTAPPSRHFQFRTTFTVDPRGEFAIQQMLLTHPLTNSLHYVPPYGLRHRRYYHDRRDQSTTNFRRRIYDSDLWVLPSTDVTGRYREASPSYYRSHPGAINRLAPWLNRELNALLEGNTQHVMTVVDLILSHLDRHHIKSTFFKNLLRRYLGSKTRHFIHEFYTFMRSPYDMLGFDQNSYYRPSFDRMLLPERDGVTTSEDEEDGNDDDVTIVATSNAPSTTNNANTVNSTNPFHSPTLEVIEIDDSNDSDVIIQEPTPVIVDLLSSDSDSDDVIPIETDNKESPKPSTSVNVDLRTEANSSLKYNNRKKNKRPKRRHGKEGIYSSSDLSSSESKYVYRKPKKYKRKCTSSSSSDEDSSSDSNVGYARKRFKRKGKRLRKSRRITSSSSSSTSTYSSSASDSASDDRPSTSTCSGRSESSKNKFKIETETQFKTDDCTTPERKWVETTTSREYVDGPLDYSMASMVNYPSTSNFNDPGPSYVKKEITDVAKSKEWQNVKYNYNSDDDEDDD